MKSTIVYGLFACSIMIAACEKQDKADSPNTLNSGLIAFYPFSGNTNDESGNGYHLVNNGASPRQDRFIWEHPKKIKIIYKGQS